MAGRETQSEDPLAQYRWKYCPFCGNEFVLDENRCSSCLAKRASSRWEIGQNERKKPWRKILWERQPYEDNYVDHTFLIGLRKNVNVVEYDYWTVVRDSVTVSHQITIVALFLCIFMYTYYGTLSLRILLPLNATTFILGYLLRLCTDQHWRGVDIVKSDIPRIVLTSAIVLTLSPIIHTLTQNISGDTIVALTVLMWLLHLALHDYSGYRPLPSPSPSTSLSGFSPISLNAAIFASVLLTSRLASPLEVSAIIGLSIQFFTLLPILYGHLRQFSRVVSVFFSWFLILLTAVLIFPLSKLLASLYILSILVITFLCPYWLKWIQKFKNAINGPWDEAIPVPRTRY